MDDSICSSSEKDLKMKTVHNLLQNSKICTVYIFLYRT